MLIKLFLRRAALLLVLLSASSAGQAQVFWSVRDADGANNWLLGTVHSEDPRLLEFPEPLMEALRRADRLALELVPDRAILSQLNQAMYFDEQRLDELLEPKLYRQVATLMDKAYGLGEPGVRRMRPWAAAMTLSLPPPETGLFMDLALSYRASALDVEVMALETFDEQLAFLAGLSEPEQIGLLRQAVADHGSIGETFESLIEHYLAGDLAALERESRRQMALLDQAIVDHFNRVGIIERNQTMLTRALPYLRQGGTLIAVGALHLPGEQGLLELLRQQGFEVEGIY